MASEKILAQKQQAAQDLSEKLKAAQSIVLVDYKGIDVATDTKLRAEMREEGVEYVVVKNSLLRFACKEAGLEDLVPLLAGTTALAYSEDQIAPARVLQKYSDQLRSVFNLKGGIIDGKLCDAAELKTIAMLPSRDGLIAQVAGSLNSIIASIARALSEVAKKNEEAA